MSGAANFIELVTENARLMLVNRKQAGDLEALRAELVSSLIRVEDLAEALHEAINLVEDLNMEGTERTVARWRRLLTV